MSPVLRFLIIYIVIAGAIAVLFARAPTKEGNGAPSRMEIIDAPQSPPEIEPETTPPFSILKSITLTKDSTASGHDITALSRGDMRVNVSCTEPVSILLFNATYFEEWLNWNEQKIPFTLREKHTSYLVNKSVQTGADDILVVDASEADVWGGAWRINCTIDIESTPSVSSSGSALQ